VVNEFFKDLSNNNCYLYVPNGGAPNFIKQTQLDIKGQKDADTMKWQTSIPHYLNSSIIQAKNSTKNFQS
jgi:hypothetical protein